MADVAKLAPLFAKLAEAAQEISEVFAGGSGTLGKRGALEAFDANGKPIKKKKEKRAPRAPTAFNLFMKKAVAEVKLEKPGMNPKQIFAECAAKWKDSPDNPKAGLGTLAIADDVPAAAKGKKAPKNKDEKASKKKK